MPAEQPSLLIMTETRWLNSDPTKRYKIEVRFNSEKLIPMIVRAIRSKGGKAVEAGGALKITAKPIT